MNNPIHTIIIFLLISSTTLYSISILSRVKDLDNKVTVIQERQEQLIQLINNHR